MSSILGTRLTGAFVAMEPEQIGELVAAAAAGDGSAWRLLVEHFSGLVWAVARTNGLDATDAADVLQLTWLRLTEHLDRIEHPDRVGAWLATTARREAQRFARADRRLVPIGDPAMLEPEATDDNPPEQAVLDAEQAAADAERGRLLWRAFRELPVRCQELLRVLTASPPPSYLEAAAALEMRVGSIGPTRARCLRRLRVLMAERHVTDRRRTGREGARHA